MLNIIYGIAAVGNAHFFDNILYVLSFHAWGWITIIVGIIQLTAGFSLFGGGGSAGSSASSPRASARSSRCCRSAGRIPGGVRTRRSRPTRTSRELARREPTVAAPSLRSCDRLNAKDAVNPPGPVPIRRRTMAHVYGWSVRWT